MEFVDVKGYEGLYKINRNGDIWSCRSKKYLKPTFPRGYKYIMLSKHGKLKNLSIHRLVALHFIPNPNNLKCVDHINRIKTDNRIENLRWASHRENNINMDKVDNRKGYIAKMPYTKKDGTTRIYHQLRYNLSGEYGDYKNCKTFKTLQEAEEFRNQIYGL